MASTVRDSDNGWKTFKKALGKLGEKEVVVGIPGEVNFAGPSPAAIGTVHEFGSQDGKTPARSFLRSTFDQQESKYEKLLTSHVKRMQKSKKVDDGALLQVGNVVRTDVVGRITGTEILQDLQDEDDRNRAALDDAGNLIESIVAVVRKRQ